MKKNGGEAKSIILANFNFWKNIGLLLHILYLIKEDIYVEPLSDREKIIYKVEVDTAPAVSQFSKLFF